MRSPLEREVEGSNLWLVKPDASRVANGSRLRCNISLQAAVLLGRNDVEIGLANLLHASAKYSD